MERAAGGGFTDAAPWLPLGDLAATNVPDQRDDPGSVLTLCRDLIAFRRRHPEFSTGDTATLATPAEVWALTRGERHVVALNMSSEALVVAGLSGTVRSAPIAPASTKPSAPTSAWRRSKG